MIPSFPNLRCREIVREAYGDCVYEAVRLTIQQRPELTPDLIEAYVWGVVRGHLLVAQRARQSDDTHAFLAGLMDDLDREGFVRVSQLMHDVFGEVAER